MYDYETSVFGMFGGRDRYEQSIDVFVEFAQIPPWAYVLELCCGTGISTKYILNKVTNPGHITAVELNP